MAMTLYPLTTKEQSLLDETRPHHLRGLDEDSLVELHGRVRRARDKYVKLHRREVAEQVRVKGGRGSASAPPRRSAAKAEAFEGALARVSAGLAKAARQSAAALRAERLAAARSARGDGSAVTGSSTTAVPTPPKRPRARARAPIERKVAAASRAHGARAQAKGDARRSGSST